MLNNDGVGICLLLADYISLLVASRFKQLISVPSRLQISNNSVLSIKSTQSNWGRGVLIGLYSEVVRIRLTISSPDSWLYTGALTNQYREARVLFFKVNIVLLYEVPENLLIFLIICVTCLRLRNCLCNQNSYLTPSECLLVWHKWILSSLMAVPKR